VRIAMTVLGERISPVFDVSQHFVLVDVEEGREISRRAETVAVAEPLVKLDRLSEWAVSAVICGAISRPLAEMLIASGVRVIPFVAGDAEDVLAAYLRGELPGPSFVMPGCRCARGRRLRGRGMRRAAGCSVRDER